MEMTIAGVLSLLLLSATTTHAADDQQIITAVVEIIKTAGKEAASANGQASDISNEELCTILDSMIEKVAKSQIPQGASADMLTTAAELVAENLKGQTSIWRNEGLAAFFQNDVNYISIWTSEAKTDDAASRRYKRARESAEAALERKTDVFFAKIVKQRYTEGVFLGSGNYGRVFAAIDTQNNNKEVAVKIGEKQFAKLQDEFNSAELFLKTDFSSFGVTEKSKFVPQVYERKDAENKEWEYLTMDLVGDPWESVLEQQLFDSTHTKRITARAFHILKAIHSKGLAHGDAHPGNFVFSRKPDEPQRLFLIDFGRSKKLVSGGSFNRAAKDYFYLKIAILSFGKQWHSGENLLSAAQKTELNKVFPLVMFRNQDAPAMIPFWKLTENDVASIEAKLETFLKAWIGKDFETVGKLDGNEPLFVARNPSTSVAEIFKRGKKDAIKCKGGSDLSGFTGTIGPMKHSNGKPEISLEVAGECKKCSEDYTGKVAVSVVVTFAAVRPTKLSTSAKLTFTTPTEADAKAKKFRKQLAIGARNYVNHQMMPDSYDLDFNC